MRYPFLYTRETRNDKEHLFDTFCRKYGIAHRRCLEIVRQNILLSQNGSTLNSCRNSGKTKIGCPKGHPIFVVRSTGIEHLPQTLNPFILKGF